MQLYSVDLYVVATNEMLLREKPVVEFFEWTLAITKRGLGARRPLHPFVAFASELADCGVRLDWALL